MKCPTTSAVVPCNEWTSPGRPDEDAEETPACRESAKIMLAFDPSIELVACAAAAPDATSAPGKRRCWSGAIIVEYLFHAPEFRQCLQSGDPKDFLANTCHGPVHHSVAAVCDYVKL
jgi:hypothetical protein